MTDPESGRTWHYLATDAMVVWNGDHFASPPAAINEWLHRALYDSDQAEELLGRYGR